MSNGYRWEILPTSDGGLFLNFWDAVGDIGDTCIEVQKDGTALLSERDPNDEENEIEREIDLAEYLVGWVRNAGGGG